MAEIWALRDGLTLAKESNLHNVEVEVDAMGVIQLLNDANAVNHSLRNILLDCRSLILELDVVTINHIYREVNRCADALANDTPVSVGDFHVYPFNMCLQGIYVGEGMVIHFVSSSSILGISSLSSTPGKKTCPYFHPRCGIEQKPGSGVGLSCLACFERKGTLYRFEYGVTKTSFQLHIRGGTCTTAESDPKNEGVHRANYLSENGGFGNYNLFKNNCEDFALYCKTGLLTIDDKGRSGQIGDLVKMLPRKVKAKYFSHCVGRYASDIGVRGDVIKVPVEDLDDFHHGLAAGTSTQDDKNDLQNDDNATQDDENDLSRQGK